jgi:serine O-acetyltransferase
MRLNSTVSNYVILKYRILNLLHERYSKNLVFIFILVLKPVDILFQCNSQISHKAKIGKCLRLPHKASGVVISQYAEIGDNVTIYQGVTIGVHPRFKSVKINDNCVIGPNSVIISAEINRNSYIKGASYIDGTASSFTCNQ